MMQRSKAFAVALLAFVFLAGGAAGWAIHDRLEGPRPRGGRRSVERLVERLAHDLDLNAAQKDSVRAVLERRHRETRSLWESVRPEMDRIRRSTQQDIDAFLTPDQVERHRRMIEEEDRRHAQDERGADSVKGGAR
jgi:hypothetical protein